MGYKEKTLKYKGKHYMLVSYEGVCCKDHCALSKECNTVSRGSNESKRLLRCHKVPGLNCWKRDKSKPNIIPFNKG